MDGVGVQAIMAYKVLTAWADAWVAVDSYMGFLSETLTANHERIDDESLEGYGGKLPSYLGNQVVQGDTEHNWGYAADVLIPAVMGILAGTVATVGEVMSGAACTADKYFGLEFAKGGARNHRFWAAMPNKFVLAGEKGGLVKQTVSWAARQFSSEAAAVLTNPTAEIKVKFDQGVFRIADQANALAGGDEYAIESFELTLDRSMKLDDYVMASTLPRQALEPKENAFRTCQLAIKLPRYAADTLAAWRQGDEPLQCDFTFTGPGTATKLLELTEVRIVDGFNSNVGGPEVLVLEGTLDCFRGGAHGFMYAGNELRFTYTT